MAYKMEPGRVIHTNDYDEVDSEIVFKAPDGENAFEIVSAYFTPGTRTQKIQNTMMQMVMDSMRANLWDVVQRVLGKPYQLRGNRPETGFDVGGIIQYIYNNIYGVSFSNDVKKQLASVQHLPLNEAIPGDLLFWGTPDLISNAGVYLGGGRYLTVDLMGGIVMIQTVSKTWEPDFVGSLR